MTTLSTYRIRLALNARTFTALNCVLSGTSPAIWNGVPVDIEVALYSGDTFIDDKTGITTLYLEIYDNPDRQGPALLQKSIDAADITDINEEQWSAGTHQTAKFELDQADTTFALDNADGESQLLWMFFYAVIASENIGLGSALLTVYVNGTPSGAVIGTTSPNWRITAGGKLQLYNQDTGLYHDIYINGTSAQEELIISVGEA